MPHVDSGWRCAMDHGDQKACVKCVDCAKFIRPEDMGEECPASGRCLDGETAEETMRRIKAKQ